MLRLATRRSSLARAQTFGVGRLLAQATGDDFELVVASTTGDEHPEQAVAAFDAKGLFVDGTRRAVLDGRADLVVHSAKDLPSGSAEGLALAAVPPRADPRDALVTRDGRPLGKLAAGAVVGTSSERRRVQLQAAAPQLEVVGLRGNLDTRLRKVADGTLDACVVAMAGLQRMLAPCEQGGVGALEVGVRIAALEPGECLPAPAQGALAVEARTDDAAARAAAARVDDGISHTRLLAERALLAGLDAGCLSAVGALAQLTDVGAIELLGMWGDPDTGALARRSLTGGFDKPARLGRELADDLTAALDG
jgi:hydroxymethylbilane synthase